MLDHQRWRSSMF